VQCLRISYLITLGILFIFATEQANAFDQISVTDISIIEIDPDPGGKSKEDMGIILFNPFNNSIDLSGWQISLIQRDGPNYWEHPLTQTEYPPHILSGNISACDDIKIIFPHPVIDDGVQILVLKDNFDNVVYLTSYAYTGDFQTQKILRDTPDCVSTSRENPLSKIETYPDRQHGTVSTSNASPILGDASAPVTIIEFGDLRDYTSAEFISRINHSPIQNYIETGKVNLVFFNILSLSNSDIVSEASFCAEDQGMYWEFFDLMYHYRSMGIQEIQFSDEFNASKSLKKLASQLDLDVGVFENCLDSGKYTQRVLNNQYEAIKLEFSSSSSIPAFFVVGSNFQKEILLGTNYLELKTIITESLPLQKTTSQTLGTTKGTLAVKLYHNEIISGQQIMLNVDFVNPNTNQLQKEIDWTASISKDSEILFGPTTVSHSSEGSLRNLKYVFEEDGVYNLKITIEGILFQPIPSETVSFNIVVGDPNLSVPSTSSQELFEDEPIMQETNVQNFEESSKTEETKKQSIEEISEIFDGLAKFEPTDEQITIQVDDSVVDGLNPILPYIGVGIAGIIAIIALIKIKGSKKDEFYADDDYEENYDDQLEQNLTAGNLSMAKKYQDLQSDSSQSNLNEFDVEKLIQDKLRIISELQKHKIGNYQKLEKIKQSLIENESFNQEDGDYLQKKYEEYQSKKDSD
jgi:protein-disulfide isomerase